MAFVEEHRLLQLDGVEYARFDLDGYAHLGREVVIDGIPVRRAIGLRVADHGGTVSDDQLVAEVKAYLDEFVAEPIGP